MVSWLALPTVEAVVFFILVHMQLICLEIMYSSLIESETWTFAGNTRTVNQKELEIFREELQSRLSNNYNVILKERKLPLSLLNDHAKVCMLI